MLGNLILSYFKAFDYGFIRMILVQYSTSYDFSLFGELYIGIWLCFSLGRFSLVPVHSR